MPICAALGKTSLISTVWKLKIIIVNVCRKAGRVEDVYQMSDLLSSDELDILEEAAQALLEEFNSEELIEEAAKKRQ